MERTNEDTNELLRHQGPAGVEALPQVAASGARYPEAMMGLINR